ncbi:hypothetical protein BH09BAC6_BH09BAC6_32210 [soil metagenome]
MNNEAEKQQFFKFINIAARELDEMIHKINESIKNVSQSFDGFPAAWNLLVVRFFDQPLQVFDPYLPAIRFHDTFRFKFF